MTLQAVLTYTLIAEVFAEQLHRPRRLDDAFWEGTVVTRFLRRMGMVGQFAAEMAGRWAFGFCTFSLPLLLVAPLLGVDPAPASAAAAGWFVVSLGLAVVGRAGARVPLRRRSWLRLDMSVWLLEQLPRRGRTSSRGRCCRWRCCPGASAALAWLPFAAMASAPLRIYTGTGDPLPLLRRRSAGRWCSGRSRAGSGGPTASGWSSHGG